MYLWNIEKLKQQISADQLSEKDRFIYAFIYIVLTSVLAEIMVFLPIENANFWDAVESVATVVTICIGTLFTYRANGADKGYDFLGKYFSIGLVIGIRFVVYAIPMFILLYFYYFYAFSEDEQISSSAVDTLPFVVWYALSFWRIGVHIKQVS